MMASKTSQFPAILAVGGYTLDVILVLGLIILAVLAVTKSNRK